MRKLILSLIIWSRLFVDSFKSPRYSFVLCDAVSLRLICLYAVIEGASESLLLLEWGVTTMSGRKMGLSVVAVGFGVVRVFCGLLLLWGQFEYQEPGTFYGFAWPGNLHMFLVDFRGLFALSGAVWLIRIDIFGERRELV
jgi:hypothetical protein